MRSSPVPDDSLQIYSYIPYLFKKYCREISPNEGKIYQDPSRAIIPAAFEVSGSAQLSHVRASPRDILWDPMGTFCDLWVARGRASRLGHGAVVFCHSPGGVIQSRRARQRNHRVLQEKTWEKKMPTKRCVPLCTNKRGHTFPFNDRPRLKAWIVAVRREEAKWQPSKHNVVCRAHFSNDAWLHHLDIRWYVSTYLTSFPVDLFVYTRERPFHYLGGGWKAFVEQIIFFSWCK